MNVGIITMEKVENRPPGSVGSSRIRGKWLWNNWNECEEFQVGHNYDVIIFQKAYWKEMLSTYKGIKIFDLCDPDWLEPRPVVEAMEHCHAMVTSSQSLADYVKKFIPNKPVICIPDRVDLKEHKPRDIHQGIARKAVWFGYSHNIHYIQKTFDYLIENNLQLTIISNTPYNPPFGFDKLKVLNINYDYKSIHDNVKECDIALFPETNDDMRGKFKTNNKTLTSWALGLPVAKTPDDLVKFMSADERNKERELRLQEIKEKWDIKLSVKEYKSLIQDLQNQLNKSVIMK